MIILFLMQMQITQTANVACTAINDLTGCTACDAPASQALALDQATAKFICTDILNCIQVQNELCIRCDWGFYLNSTSGNCTTIPVTNCLTYTNSVCETCQSGYSLVGNDTCVLDNIQYCVTYDTGGTCTQCLSDVLDAASGCTLNTSLCSVFDYTLWKCTSCPANTQIHSNGEFCITAVSNCLTYTSSGCSRCEQQYLLSLGTCVFTASVLYQLSTTLTICLNPSLTFNTGASTCDATGSSFSYCLSDNTTACTECLPGFYLSNGACLSCDPDMTLNCLTCTSSLICTQCEPEYFLNTQTINGITQTNCRECEIYGCEKCQFDSTTQTVQCLSCDRTATLYAGECYSCSSGSYFDIFTKQCQTCSTFDANCMHCSSTQCQWCNSGYALDNTNACTLITAITAAQLSSSSISEIVIKAFPQQEDLIFKDSSELFSNCQQSANQYTCRCTAIANTTNLCYGVNTTLNALDLSGIFSGTIISDQVFLENTQALRYMSQLSTFDSLTLSLTGSTLFPDEKFAALLEIYTQQMRRNSLTNTSNDATLTTLFSIVQNSLPNTFLSTQTTVIYGNGYYLKYYPTSTATDTNSDFITITSGLTDRTCIFVWFENLETTTNVIGHLYAYSPTSSSSLTLSVKQLVFPSQSYNYLFYLNSALQTSSTVTQNDNNFIGITVSTSSLTTFNEYEVQYQLVDGAIESLYSEQRIERIFYQTAFIYILVFLVLYIFLIPFCSIVDLCHKPTHRRKRIRSQQISGPTQESQQMSKQEQQATKQVISVNYRDFFPLYNIANTPRPRRILKLCLFILNLQHGITFLTLIYFNLDAGHPVTAVVLGIPAYLCTVIMGYACGMATILLPGALKYLINLLVLGYWILWVALMPIFISSEYTPYVVVLAIIFVFIDLLFDLLETFMVYFTIKQSEKQINMFRCLATWLSKRGFYEFDKLAKELSEADA